MAIIEPGMPENTANDRKLGGAWVRGYEDTALITLEEKSSTASVIPGPSPNPKGASPNYFSQK